MMETIKIDSSIAPRNRFHKVACRTLKAHKRRINRIAFSLFDCYHVSNNLLLILTLVCRPKDCIAKYGASFVNQYHASIRGRYQTVICSYLFLFVFLSIKEFFGSLSLHLPLHIFFVSPMNAQHVLADINKYRQLDAWLPHVFAILEQTASRRSH